MYTTTFYSFKGGVGRSMALVNVAFEFASQGKTVLIVDFDLEAPGLQAFLEPYNTKPSRGVVDFITDYRATGAAPDVSNYLYEIDSVASPNLWFMPAGKSTKDYSSKLNSIDWQKLYEHENGYLLFEDLKAQWDQYIKPDYVFLDSRTGHTDVSGICTRQLPDSVVLLFRLDNQNLEGLCPVVENIKDETKTLKREIKIRLVPSNVPDIDDENGVLEKQISLFKNKLGFIDDNLMIRHFTDLGMLSHCIYTLDRPKTKLASEYRKLCKEISVHNVEDIEGVRDYLEKLVEGKELFLRKNAEDIENKINKISISHRQDREILFLLANLRSKQGKFQETISYLSEILSADVSDIYCLIMRATLQKAIGNISEAREDLISILRLDVSDYFDVLRLVSLISRIDPELLNELPTSKAVESLNVSEKLVVAQDLATDGYTSIARKILENIVRGKECSDRLMDLTKTELVLIAIGERKFSEAIKLIGKPLDIIEQFNFAMATWGESGEVPVDNFKKVLNIDTESSADSSDHDANYYFCMAIVYFALGNFEEALAKIDLSRSKADWGVNKIFSPWDYSYKAIDLFVKDLDRAESLISEESGVPVIIGQGNVLEGEAHA